LPIWVLKNGMPVFSTKRRSIWEARLRFAPAPIRSSGDRASAIISDAMATARSLASGRRTFFTAKGGLLVALCRDVLRQLDVYGPGALGLRLLEGLADDGRDPIGLDDLLGELGEGLHHRHRVDDLEMPLLAGVDGLLAGDHAHRHGPELRIGGRGHEVGGTRTQGRQTHARDAGETAHRGCHEAGRLLVAGDDEPDARGAQGLDEVQVFFARHAEDVLYPLILEAPDEEITRFHGLPHENVLPQFYAMGGGDATKGGSPREGSH
jgi:hypothetical protein